MICQLCGMFPATTHVSRRHNGKVREWHLCTECAVKEGVIQSHASTVDSLFDSLFSRPFIRESDSGLSCPSCGMTYRELVQGGQLGCPNCYTAFFDRLQPSIQRIHGKTVHAGKIAACGSESQRHVQQLAALKAELEAAVSAQEFERCAELRDAIKRMEEEET